MQPRPFPAPSDDVSTRGQFQYSSTPAQFNAEHPYQHEHMPWASRDEARTTRPAMSRAFSWETDVIVTDLDADMARAYRAMGYRAKCIIRNGKHWFFIYRWRM